MQTLYSFTTANYDFYSLVKITINLCINSTNIKVIKRTTKALVFTGYKKLKIIDFTCVFVSKVVQLPRQFNNEPYF